MLYTTPINKQRSIGVTVAVKGIKQAKRSTAKMVGKITGQLSERTVTEVCIIGQGHASMMTPIDTSNLINSQYRRVTTTSSGVVGMVGYTAHYAAAVHSFSGKLKGKPRQHFGRTKNYSDVGPLQSVEFGGGTGVGNYWDPNAEPQFLKKAFEEEGKAEIMAAIKRGMKV